MINKISYFIGDGFRNIFKSKVEALSSITTIGMCIFVIGIMYMVFTNVSNTIEKIQNDMNIIAYLDSSTSRGNAEALKTHVLENEYVTEIVLFTKEEALVEFSKEIENGENLIEQYQNDNPLRDSLRIKVSDQSKIDEVVTLLNDSSFVKRIVKPNDAVEFLTQLSNKVKLVGIIFIIVLVVMSIILIINTIKLTVYIRKNDIQIMKYIGATDWFVRLPFIVEGILLGIIGTALPLIALYIIYSLIYDSISGNTTDALYKLISLRSVGEVYNFLLPLCAVIGIGIGTVGSTISIRKYLEV